MPAKSKKQRRLFAIALEYKRGNIKKSEVSDDVVKLAELPLKTLKDYAETPEADLPEDVDEGMSIMGGGMPYGHEFTSAVRNLSGEAQAILKDKANAEANSNKNKRRGKPISNYDEWLKKAKALQEMEGGAATGVNTPGMGNATPASRDGIGSGDSFGSNRMNYEDWKRWNKMRKKTQRGERKKGKKSIIEYPNWEDGEDQPVPVVNVQK